MEEEREKRRFITDYFSNLFRSASNHDSDRLLSCVDRRVTNEMNEALTKEYTEKSGKR